MRTAMHVTPVHPYPLHSVRPPRPRRYLRISLPLITAVCFFAGIAAGTVWIGTITDEVKEQLSMLGNPWLSRPQAGDLSLFFQIFLKREMTAGFLWLIGMTAFSVPVLLFTSLYAGFSLASLLSLMTVQQGLLGLPVFLASALPQALLYLPALAVLFFWGFEPLKKTHLAGFLILSAITSLGAFTECFINPFLLRFITFLR